jgi:hypothetical protein
MKGRAVVAAGSGGAGELVRRSPRLQTTEARRP